MKLNKTALIAFIIFAESSFAIINGTEEPSDSPVARATVVVAWTSYLEGGRGQCSGTLIDVDVVLTAAHCVSNFENIPKSPSEIKVYFGNYEKEKRNQNLIYDVVSIEPHPDYYIENKSLNHDIALIRLKKPAPSPFSPVQYLTNKDVLAAETEMLLAGYGNTLFFRDPREPEARTLRSFKTLVKTPVNDQTGMIDLFPAIELMANFNFQIPQTPGHPELFGHGGMAGGDSGGPAFVTIDNQLVVAGVAARYTGPNGEIPSYENIPSHGEWIEETLKKLK